MTSFPARIRYIHHTLYSIFTQDCPPDMIALFLCEEEFPTRKIPRILELFVALNLMTIHWVSPNLRPANRIIHAMKAYPNDIIITVDDEHIYDKTLLSKLLASYKRHPHCISSHWVDTHLPFQYFKIPFDCGCATDTIVSNCEMHHILEDIPLLYAMPLQVSGVLYPPHCLDDEVFNIQSYSALCPLQDDLWVLITSALKGTKKVLIKNALYEPRNPSIPYFATPNLWESNVLEGGSMKQLTALLEAYPKAKSALLESIRQNPPSRFLKNPNADSSKDSNASQTSPNATPNTALAIPKTPQRHK